jgi:integrase
MHRAERDRLENEDLEGALREFNWFCQTLSYLGKESTRSLLSRQGDYLSGGGRHAATIRAGWKGREPYCLRHSALTMLAESGCDAFTLARIAGHSSITITQRYCHPPADAIERAFGKFSGGHNIGHTPQLAAKNESGAKAATDKQIES